MKINTKPLKVLCRHQKTELDKRGKENNWNSTFSIKHLYNNTSAPHFIGSELKLSLKIN